MFAIPKKLHTFVIPNGKPPQGTRGISSVGRAFEWHSKGQEFDSPMLHKKGIATAVPFFVERRPRAGLSSYPPPLRGCPQGHGGKDSPASLARAPFGRPSASKGISLHKVGYILATFSRFTTISAQKAPSGIGTQRFAIY